MNSRLKELFSNTLVFTIANFSSKILVFLMVPLYTAVLSTDEFGISDMVTTIGGLMLPVLSFSISHAVLRFCFVKDCKREDVFSIGHKTILFGAVCALIITTVFYYLQIFPDLTFYIWFVPFHFLLNAYSSFLSDYCRGVGKVKISAIAGVANTVTTVSLNLLFLLIFRFGILGYLISFLSGPAVSIILMGFNISAHKLIVPKPNAILRKQMFSFSAPLIPNNLSWWALDSFNRFVILSYLGVSAVGLYSASAKIPAILTALCSIFTQAWTLSALNGYGTEDNLSFIRSIHKKLFALLSFVTALFVLLSKPLALLLLSGEFSICWPIIPFLMIAVFMGAMTGFYGSIYSAERKNKMQFLSTMGGALVSIVVMLLFLESFGIIIAAVSNMVGYFIIWFMRKEGIKKYIDIGMSTAQCVLFFLLLVGEALFVSFSLWLPAISLFLIVLFINRNDLAYMLSYFGQLALNFINNKNGRAGNS